MELESGRDGFSEVVRGIDRAVTHVIECQYPDTVTGRPKRTERAARGPIYFPTNPKRVQ